jgi:hypothetical protein
MQTISANFNGSSVCFFTTGTHGIATNPQKQRFFAIRSPQKITVYFALFQKIHLIAMQAGCV